MDRYLTDWTGSADRQSCSQMLNLMLLATVFKRTESGLLLLLRLRSEKLLLLHGLFRSYDIDLHFLGRLGHPLLFAYRFLQLFTKMLGFEFETSLFVPLLSYAITLPAKF